MLVTREGVPYQELVPHPKEDEHEAMAASKDHDGAAGVDGKGEAGLRDAIGGLQRRFEMDGVESLDEAAEEGRVAAVVLAEAADEGR